ncbi:hypothetical protein evm_011493 [Chilo suppressalis]|nr:hypothetical protein evm_011493 [Chilo suppressalis]
MNTCLLIAPLELEAILQFHLGVREAEVVGKPVPDFGCTIHAAQRRNTVYRRTTKNRMWKNLKKKFKRKLQESQSFFILVFEILVFICDVSLIIK